MEDEDLLPSSESDEDFDPLKDTGGEAEDRAQLRVKRGRAHAEEPVGEQEQEDVLPERGSKRQRQVAEEAFALLSGKAPAGAGSEGQGGGGQGALGVRSSLRMTQFCRPVGALDTATPHDESWKVHLGLREHPPRPAHEGHPAAARGEEEEAPGPRPAARRGMSAAEVLASLGAAVAPGAAGRVASVAAWDEEAGEAGGRPEGAPREARQQATALAGEAAAPGRPPCASAPPAATLSVAAAALAAAKAAGSLRAATQRGRVTVAETRRFAGQNIQVEREVSEAERQAERQRRNRAGLDAVMASLQSVRKVNVLDKSRQDWSTFKRSNEEVEVELHTYQKSGTQYLDKVDFLKRAELSEYAAERDARLRGDVRSRGRL